MKPLPIGKDDFEKIINEGCYYVDKTGAIEDLLRNKAEIVLFPRPRRFGKSLFISMLENFFDIDKKEENKNLFEKLYISKSEFYNELSNYPVISIDFKDLKSSSFNSTFYMLKSRISEIYRDKEYVVKVLDEIEKEKFNLIKNEKGSIDDYKDSIKLLSNWLERFHKRRVIVLIDEYDAAINESYICGYYDELMDLMQPLLSSALKGNNSLKMGVLTGVLRIGGESLFSSFNNLVVYDVMSKQYNEYFGFTESETEVLLKNYNLELTKEVEEYYDGYNFSGLYIYNPWSILNYASEKVLKPYWMNTGSNLLLKKLLNETSNKEEIEKLIQGNSIIFKYDSSITYSNFTEVNNFNNLLNLLLVTGYVTFDKEEEKDYGKKQYFKIPNKEVSVDLTNILSNITFNSNIFVSNDYEKFIDSFFNNDKEYIEKFINEMLPSMSYYDYYETFYHGYSLGLFSILLNNKNFIVKSNREAGNGRYDIMLERTDRTKGVVIEFKVSENESDMDSKAQEGINQMKEKEYYKELVLDKVNNIYEYVIVFYGKKAIVR